MGSEMCIRDRYLSHLRTKGRAATTIARHLSVLRQFYAFLYAEEIKPDDPTQSIDSPKLGRRLPKYLSIKEVDRLLAAAQKHDRFDRCRLIALMEILYATGLRVSELVGLRESSISRDGQTLIVRGKGGKERMLPLTDPAREAISWVRDPIPGPISITVSSGPISAVLTIRWRMDRLVR